MSAKDGNKRVATSPASSDSGEVKRLCSNLSLSEGEETLHYSFSDKDYLSSTLLDPASQTDRLTSPVLVTVPVSGMESMGSSGSVREEVKAAMLDPVVLELLSKAIAAQVTNDLRKEISDLKERLKSKEEEICSLRDKVDELEQYGRRNNIRISSIPETREEDTDAMVQTVAKTVGVDLPASAIDRSHRVGPQGGQPRAVIVKLTSYRYKLALMKARAGLRNADGKKLFPSLQWPAPPSGSSSQSSRVLPGTKIFINEDLTKPRADLAKRARELKKANRITDTWTRDGVIFIKKGTNVSRITTPREIQAFE